MSADVGVEISAEDRAAILSPYKPETTYVRRAFAEPTRDGQTLVRAHGDFGIAESCYIADTGHFNAVEFNICYNQLAYLVLGQSVRSGWLPEMGIDSFEEYRRRQLPDFLIVRLESEFRRAIDARAFKGTVGVRSVRARKTLMLIDTEVSFSDERGGRADGKVLLGVVDSRKMA